MDKRDELKKEKKNIMQLLHIIQTRCIIIVHNKQETKLRICDYKLPKNYFACAKLILSFGLILERKGFRVYVNTTNEETWVPLNARHLEPRRHWNTFIHLKNSYHFFHLHMGLKSLSPNTFAHLIHFIYIQINPKKCK
jgi:hypothetical protein